MVLLEDQRSGVVADPSASRGALVPKEEVMNVRELVAALLANCDEDFDREVFLCPNVQTISAVEACPGDTTWGLDPYVTLHSACKYPADHAQLTLDEAS